MTLAVSLVPKILQPVVPEIEPTSLYPEKWYAFPDKNSGEYIMWVGEESLKRWETFWKEYHQRSMGIPF